MRVDYLLTPVESIELSYDPNGNLLRLLERNGDQLRMSYDSLNRLLLGRQRKSLAGPQWAFRNVYDAAGNRSGLTTNLPVYGAVFGTNATCRVAIPLHGGLQRSSPGSKSYGARV